MGMVGAVVVEVTHGLRSPLGNESEWFDWGNTDQTIFKVGGLPEAFHKLSRLAAQTEDLQALGTNDCPTGDR